MLGEILMLGEFLSLFCLFLFCFFKVFFPPFVDLALLELKRFVWLSLPSAGIKYQYRTGAAAMCLATAVTSLSSFACFTVSFA